MRRLNESKRKGIVHNNSRRTFLGTAAASAGAFSLGFMSGCEPQKPEPVKPLIRNHPLDGIERENIKITDVRVRLFSCKIPPNKWWFGSGVTILTEIYTDSGIVGIGGPSPYGGPELVKKYTEEFIKPALIGQNPFDVEFITAGGPPFVQPGIGNPSFAETCSWAGVDIACWDIIGKVKNMPVHKLLAIDNEPNPHILHYASGGAQHDWTIRPEDLIDEALRYKEEGFTSFKFRKGENWRTVPFKQYMSFMGKLREAVGDDFGLMHENNMGMSVEECLEFAPVLEELKFTWLEEPVNRWGTNPVASATSETVKKAIEEHIRICEALPTVKVSGGESMAYRHEFREWIDRDAYDIVQPDCDITGLTEGWYIARMAHLKGKPCVPHNWHGDLTWMSNIQLVAAIPNQLILESERHYNPFRGGLFKEPIVVKNSYADAPDKPGLGVEIIDDADKKFPYDPSNHW